MNYLIKTSLKLCLVTNVSDHNFITQVIKGGVTMVQLRDKSNNYEIIKQKAINMRNILKPHNIPFIINDYVELAKEIDADGVHLGQEDMDVDEARNIIGDNKIIGLSVENMYQLEKANKIKSITYVAASAIYPSNTKDNCKEFWGIEGLRKCVLRSKHPVMAIGGINQQNIENIIKTGSAGVAVVGAIQNAKNPEIAASILREKIDLTKLSRTIYIM
jgi:thiamine-phosphate pyrophosphorylase